MFPFFKFLILFYIVSEFTEAMGMKKCRKTGNLETLWEAASK